MTGDVAHDVVEAFIHLVQMLFDPGEALFGAVFGEVETFVHGLKPFVYAVEALVHTVKTLICTRQLLRESGLSLLD